MDLSNLKEIFDKNCERYIDEWKELLRFQSISTGVSHIEECVQCAQWLADHLQEMGLEAKILATDTKPIVFAEKKGLPEKPVILFYGHYDVQPADPLDKWDAPPFEPTLKDGRLYARGAQDNKGQLFYVIKAIETLIENDAMDSTIKIIIEGEEESGSQAIIAGLPHWKDLFKADVLLVSDTGTVHSGAPTIIMGLRGLAYLTVTLSGPSHDLHSGTHGGTAPNVATEMARLLSTLHKADGSIAIDNYYDTVTAPTALEKSLADTVHFDSEYYKEQTGVLPTAGEPEFSPSERTGFRPSIDINGMQSGYNGAGVKTIIPASATAKISARLVPDQDPAQTLEQIIKHLKLHTPAGLTLEISDEGSSGPGFRLDPESRSARTAKEVLSELSDKETAFLWEGASIPIINDLSRVSGAEPLLVGFGSEHDNIHAPNESFSIDQFKLGYLYSAQIICAL